MAIFDGVLHTQDVSRIVGYEAVTKDIVCQMEHCKDFENDNSKSVGAEWDKNIIRKVRHSELVCSFRIYILLANVDSFNETNQH